MGLFIIAGLLLVAGVIFWALGAKYYENWQLIGQIVCLMGGGIMLFVLLLMMGTNRSNQAITDLEKDYTIYTLALEECNTSDELNAIRDRINAYNDTINEHRTGRQSEMTNWLYSPKVAEMPLIIVPDYKLQEAE